MAKKNDLILVLGAESSGTRAVTQLLVENGYHGSYTHKQSFDTQSLSDANCVWRRSIPHAQKIPDFKIMLEKANKHNVKVIVTIRDWFAVMSSQGKNGHVQTSKDALDRTRQAYSVIFNSISYLPYIIINFEQLNNLEYLQRNMAILGINIEKTISDVDFKTYYNKKHYENPFWE